jgi:hypothetical protein
VTIRNRPPLALLACLAATTLLTACAQCSPEAGRPNTAPPPSSTSASAPPSGSTSTPASPGDTTSPTSFSSAVPSAPPTRPEAAGGLTLAAAEQFVRYYSDLMNYASATGDTQPMLGASDSGCENCKSYADFVTKANAANGLLKGDYRERITDIPELYRGQGGHVGGSASVAIGAYVSRETNTAAPVNINAAKYKREFALSPAGGNWVMYEMKLVKQ